MEEQNLTLLKNIALKTFQHKNKISAPSERRKEERRKADLPILFVNRRKEQRRIVERRRIERRIQEIRFTISDKLKKNPERLWNFYLDANFLYESKLNFLHPIKNEIYDTIETLLNCRDDTCKFIFILKDEDIIGSVMAAQYTNDTWMVQHIVTSPHHKLLTKELILEILQWMIKNQKMRYFINYFQDKTRWAYKTYHSLVDSIGGEDIGIESFDYLYTKLSDCIISGLKHNIRVYEIDPNKAIFKQMYKQLIARERKIVISTLGLKEDCFSIEQAEANYRKMGLLRKRKYLIAKHGNKITGLSFVDISSYGISLSLLFNAFHIFIFDDSQKEETYYALVNNINRILRSYNQLYSIGIIKQQDRVYLEKLGYTHSRTYSAFVGAGDNEQFLKSYNIIYAGRK